MRLKTVILSGYRSIKGTETLIVNDRTTVLIGANDHGKSNILEAVMHLNDDCPILANDRNWDLPIGDEPKIEWVFSLSSTENDFLTQAAAEDLKDLLDIRASISPEAPESNLERIESALRKEGEPRTTHTHGEIIFERKGIGGPVRLKSTECGTTDAIASRMLALRPQMIMFTSPSDNMQDSITAGVLEQNLVMQGLFRLAGIWQDRASLFTYSSENSKRLDDASKQLTKILNERWNQGKGLEWKLKFNSGSIEVEIKDPSISNRYSKPSLRSAGFRTYFLLSMMTIAKTAASQSTPHVYLFDEPGTYLHPHAQIDLQRSFANIAEQSQIIYTTHSMFLINKNDPGRNRVVSKTGAGTKIDQKPFQKNWKSVRDSLGILFSNNFLIADKTLLVEGPSDVIYILNAINQLKQAQEIDIDLNDLSIVDAGSSENYVAMGKLMLSEGRTVVALVDGDRSGKEVARKLRSVTEKEQTSDKLKIVSLPEGSSTEDVFVDVDVFLDAAKQVSEDLIQLGHRSFVDEQISWEERFNGIKSLISTSTLGYILDKQTASWFSCSEKLSKLSVALKYEEIIKQRVVTAEPQAKGLIKHIQETLEIRGETAYEPGVYEDTEG